MLSKYQVVGSLETVKGHDGSRLIAIEWGYGYFFVDLLKTDQLSRVFTHGVNNLPSRYMLTFGFLH